MSRKASIQCTRAGVMADESHARSCHLHAKRHMIHCKNTKARELDYALMKKTETPGFG